jgi:hypothetical protein
MSVDIGDCIPEHAYDLQDGRRARCGAHALRYLMARTDAKMRALQASDRRKPMKLAAG